MSSRRWENQWILPGGGFEPNETMEEAALREAMEEVSNVQSCMYMYLL